MSAALLCGSDEFSPDIESKRSDDTPEASLSGVGITEIHGIRLNSEKSHSNGHSYRPVEIRGELSLLENSTTNIGDGPLPSEGSDGCAEQPLALKARCDALQLEIEECRSRESRVRNKMVWIEKENRALVRLQNERLAREASLWSTDGTEANVALQDKERLERELKKERDMRCVIEQKMADGEKELEEERKRSGVVSEEAESLKEKNAEVSVERGSREEASVEVEGRLGEMERKVVEARRDADAYRKGSEEVCREVLEKEGEVQRLTSAAESFRKEVEEDKANAVAITLSLNAELAEKKHASEAMEEQMRALDERLTECAARFDASEGIEKDLRKEIRSLTVQADRGKSEREVEATRTAAVEATVESLKRKAATDGERIEDLMRCVESKTGEAEVSESEMKGWREKAAEYKSLVELSREEAGEAVRGEVEKLRGDVVAAEERGKEARVRAEVMEGEAEGRREEVRKLKGEMRKMEESKDEWKGVAEEGRKGVEAAEQRVAEAEERGRGEVEEARERVRAVETEKESVVRRLTEEVERVGRERDKEAEAREGRRVVEVCQEEGGMAEGKRRLEEEVEGLGGKLMSAERRLAEKEEEVVAGKEAERKFGEEVAECREREREVVEAMEEWWRELETKVGGGQAGAVSVPVCRRSMGWEVGGGRDGQEGQTVGGDGDGDGEAWGEGGEFGAAASSPGQQEGAKGVGSGGKVRGSCVKEMVGELRQRLGEADRWQERQTSVSEALQAEQQRKLQVAGRKLNRAEEEVGRLGGRVDGLTLVLAEAEQRLTAYAPVLKIYPGMQELVAKVRSAMADRGQHMP